MLIYLSLMLIVLVLGFLLSKKHKVAFVVIICLLMSLISGLRHSSIGNDTESYHRTFTIASTYREGVFNKSRMEPGYSFLNYVFTGFSTDFNVFLFLISLVTNIAISLLILKKSKSPTLSFILFILLMFFFDEMNILRQFLAISIVFYGIDYVERRKFWKYLLVVILASTIHISAFVTFFFYFLYGGRLSGIKKIIIYVIAIMIFAFLGELLSTLINTFGVYDDYSPTIDDNGFKVGSIINFLISLIIYVYYRLVSKKHDEAHTLNKDYCFFMNIALLDMLFSFCAIKINMFYRLVNYTSVFSVIALPNFTSLIENPKRRMLANTIIIAIAVCYFSTITYFRPNQNKVIPYKFFWE